MRSTIFGWRNWLAQRSDMAWVPGSNPGPNTNKTFVGANVHGGGRLRKRNLCDESKSLSILVGSSWAISSVVERLFCTQGVVGSNPTSVH